MRNTNTSSSLGAQSGKYQSNLSVKRKRAEASNTGSWGAAGGAVTSRPRSESIDQCGFAMRLLIDLFICYS
jgi:hypothetical protein